MPNAYIRVVELHDEILFTPTGIVTRWVDVVAAEIGDAIRVEAPVGHRPNKTDGTAPGWLKETVFSDVSQKLKTYTIEAGANADYAKFVVKGTGPVIFATTARIPAGEEGAGQFKALGEEGGMFLPANPGYGRAQQRQRVRGQAPNNFIVRGYNTAARGHGALKRMNSNRFIFND
jgi:hypothetical protein